MNRLFAILTWHARCSNSHVNATQEPRILVSVEALKLLSETEWKEAVLNHTKTRASADINGSEYATTHFSHLQREFIVKSIRCGSEMIVYLK
jgi:hypothetical protein